MPGFGATAQLRQRATSGHRGGGRRRNTFLVAAAVALGGSVTGPAAAAAVVPFPQPGQVATATSSANGTNDLFYQTQSHALESLTGSGGVWGTPVGLGGVLTSGPGAVVIGTEFAQTSVFVRGANGGVYYRQFSDGRGTWSPWAALGGRVTGAPAASCVTPGTTTALAVWARGTDGALWWRHFAQDVTGATWNPWARLGGRLASDPTGTVVGAGGCSSGPGVFALGTDHAVWELSDSFSWQRVGGASTVAPAAAVLASGETDVFVRGTDNALWRASRPTGGAAWSWHRIGGLLTSAPTVAIFPASPETVSVYALGSDHRVWEGKTVTGSGTWSWHRVT